MNCETFRRLMSNERRVLTKRERRYLIGLHRSCAFCVRPVSSTNPFPLTETPMSKAKKTATPAPAPASAAKKKKKKIKLKLVGLNGNAFVLMGAFQTRAEREGWTRAEIDAVLNEAQSKDYTHLLATLMEHCENGGSGSDDDEDDEGDEWR